MQMLTVVIHFTPLSNDSFMKKVFKKSEENVTKYTKSINHNSLKNQSVDKEPEANPSESTAPSIEI